MYCFSKSLTQFTLGKKGNGNNLNRYPFNKPDKLLKNDLLGVKIRIEKKALILIYLALMAIVYNIFNFFFTNKFKTK